MNDSSPQYDLFLSYNSQDREIVADIRQQLVQLSQSLNTFIDQQSLTLGRLWFEELQTALTSSRAVAVFYGPHGLGRWQNLEMILALDLQATADSETGIQVIPIVLPGADLTQAPRFLLLNNYLDLRSGHDSANLSSLAQAVLGQAINLDTLPASHELRNPYRGLDYFREEDAPLFFGREQVAVKLLHKVKSNKLVTLVGNSGTGKSSLLRAGLFPLLRKQHSPDKCWEVLICIPALNNVNPFHNLAVAFLQSWGNAADEIVNKRPDTEATLRHTLSLVDCIQQTLNNSPNADKLLLVIDQFEELLNFDSPDTETKANQTDNKLQDSSKTDFELFVELLLNTMSLPHCTLLLSIRGDYYGSVTERHSGLGDVIAAGTVIVSRMDDRQLIDIIEKPAKIGRGQFQDGLPQRICDDVRKQPGNLALLEFALMQLWNYRQGHSLTHEAYDTKVGKLEGAISQKADEILGSQDIADPQRTLTALTRLVRVSGTEADGGDTRQRVPLTAFSVAERANLEPFVKARLLVASGLWDGNHQADNKLQGATLEVAHEALIRHWPALQEALKGKRALLLWRQSVQTQYEQWQQLNQSNNTDQNTQSLALRGYPLQQGGRWLQDYPEELTQPEKNFINFSRQIVAKDKRVYRWLAGFIIGVVVLTVSALIWVDQNRASLRYLPTVIWTRINYALGNEPAFIPKMQAIEAGEFQMGSKTGENEDETPQHTVELMPFSIGIYEVTFEEYQPFFDAIEGNLYHCSHDKNPELDDETWGMSTRPVINVSWDDAICYAKWLSLLTGAHFHLPTEAQWEYAARAGTITDYYWEDKENAEDYAWFDENSKNKTQPVGEKLPNKLSLYDMSGNVWEWVQDCWHDNYQDAPKDGLSWNEEQQGYCSRRVLRGGSWDNTARYVRSANRDRLTPDSRNLNIGFRLARTL